MILSDKPVSSSDIQNSWEYSASGISINNNNEFKEISSDRVFLQKEVLESIRQNNTNTNRIYSYLANSINSKESSIPYSFVSAVDRYQNEKLKNNEVILSDYTAQRLNAHIGELVNISFYISQDFKTLHLILFN